MLGDFLLTRGGQRAGARKKIERLGEPCAIGWTGHLVAAEKVLRDLNHAAQQVPITRAVLENRLSAFDALEFGETVVVLIGWVIDNGQHCFRWRSDFPQEVFYPSLAYDGSGGWRIEEMAGRNMHDPAEPNAIDLGRAIQALLYVTTNLMSDEILQRVDPNRTFGHAYEVLYLDNDGFRYLDDVLYFVVTFRLAPADEVRGIEITGPLCRSHSSGEFAVSEIYDQVSGHNTIRMMTPVGLEDQEGQQALIRRVMAPEYRFRAASEYYCMSIQLAAPDYLSRIMIAWVQGPEVQAGKGIVTVDENNALSLNFPKDTIAWMIRTIRKDQEGIDQRI